MVETDVKELILERLTALIPNATSLDLSYMSGTLKTLETVGKPDISEKYFENMTNILTEMRSKNIEDSKSFNTLLERFVKFKEDSDNDK